MSYYRASQKHNELFKLRNEDWVKGLSTGIDPLDEVYTMRPGYPLFVAGSPGAGKTEVILEILLNISKLRGEKHFVYLGENGDVEEVIADLAFKLIGEPYSARSPFGMSEGARMMAEMFIDAHFVFLDDSRDYTLDEFYKQALNAEQEYGIKFNTTLFDPFNDLIDETQSYGGRDDKWLTQILKVARKSSKENKRIDILITHTADVKPIQDKETQLFYLPPALPAQWSGGRTWWRRAFCMLLVYIPPPWLKDQNGVPYGDNVSLIYIQKAKPKGVAKRNGICKIFWDWQKNRYYWIDSYGNKKNIHGTEKRKQIPLKDFTQAQTEDLF